METTKDDTWEEYIRLGLDYGTGELKLATQHIHPDSASAPVRDVKLLSQNRKIAVKQIGINLDNGEIRWGARAVDRWLSEHPQEHKRVISSWKMALLPAFRQREAVKKTIETLLCGVKETNQNILNATEIWITAHLREIKADVLEWYKRESFGNHARKPDWNRLPWEVQIAVPASWSDEAANVMTCAAKAAGFQRANTREEPQCVAGACMSQLREEEFIQENDSILFLDIGAGTSDGTIVKLRSPLTEPRMQLQRIGKAQGNQGGSLVVNDEAWKYVRGCDEIREHRNMENVLRRLGISQEECQHQVSDEVESIKGLFDARAVYEIRLRGTHIAEGPDHLPDLLIKIDRAEVRRWHETWANMNKGLLNDLLVDAPLIRTAVLTGGGSQSEYLRNQLVAHLSLGQIEVLDEQVNFPCSRGALQHYTFEKDPPLENARFYVAQQEDWDRNRHSAAEIEYDEFDSKRRVVMDRLIPIASVVNGVNVNEWGPIPQQFYINPPTGSIHVQVYRSLSAPHPAAHSPLRDPTTGNIRSGLEQYPLSFLDVTEVDIRRLNFIKRYSKRHYYARGFIEMEVTDDSIKLVVKFISAKADWDEDVNDSRSTYDPKDVFWQQDCVIWDSNCSHFIKADKVDQEAELPAASGAGVLRPPSPDEQTHGTEQGEGYFADAFDLEPDADVTDAIAAVRRHNLDEAILAGSSTDAFQDQAPRPKRVKKMGIRTRVSLDGLSRKTARQSGLGKSRNRLSALT